MPESPYAPPKNLDNDETAFAASAFSAGRMDITFTNTVVDLLLEQYSSLIRNRAVAVVLIPCLLFFSYTGALDRFGGFHLARFLSNLGNLAVTMFASFAAIIPVFFGVAMLGKARKLMFGPHRIEISDEGFTHETGPLRTTYRWHGIARIRAGSRFIRIYAVSSRIYFIPHSAFSSRQDSDAFLKLAQQLLDTAAKNPA